MQKKVILWFLSFRFGERRTTERQKEKISLYLLMNLFMFGDTNSLFLVQPTSQNSLAGMEEKCKSELEILRPKLKLMDYFLSHFFLSLRERLGNTLLQETSLENSRNHFEKELVKILEWISPQVSSQSLEKERKESLLKQVDFLWNCISRMHPTYSQDKLKTFLEELNSFENTLNSKKKVYNSNSVQSLSNNPEKPLELAKESFTFEYTPTLKSKDK